MRGLIAVLTTITVLLFAEAASANHQQGRHDCFGQPIASAAGPGFGQGAAFLAQNFRPLGAAVISIEARTCEEVLGE